MTPLEMTHLVLIFLWAGVVLAEALLEILATDEAALPHVAKLHYWIDLFLEVPLVTGVLLTGIFLLKVHGPLGNLMTIKISAALIAIAINYYCAYQVILRYKTLGNLSAAKEHNRKIRLSFLGVPLGLVALYLGLNYFS